jgi:hypothetical protein
MVNPGRPPLPPNKPYCQPLNYLQYVKDFDTNAHVRVFKANGETKHAKIVNMFNFIFRDIVTITWETTQIILLHNCN